MQIEDFSQLSDFIYGEMEKLQESTGEQIHNKSMVKYLNKTIKRYVKLYDKPLFEQEKFAIKLQKALNTMPHSFVWKIFHPELWKAIQNQIVKSESEEEKSNLVLYPDIVHSRAVEPIVND